MNGAGVEDTSANVNLGADQARKLETPGAHQRTALEADAFHNKPAEIFDSSNICR